MAGRGGAFKPVFDVCLGDQALREAVQDLAFGRWAGPRELLEATGRDWDLRTHRIRVLADAAAAGHCVEAWQIAQPRSLHAAALRAEVEVVRVFRLAARDGVAPTHRLDAAVHAGELAAQADPADPVPLVSLLTAARLYPGGNPGIERWWTELQRRDPYNREACHQVLRYFSDRYHGSERMAADFARDTARRCPAGSPLAVLPLAARVEAYRYRSDTLGAAALDLNEMWISGWAALDLDAALGRWFENRTRRFAQDVPDLHFLAHGLSFANRSAQAAAVFEQIGELAATVPWSLFGDAATQFAYWRGRALGA